MSPNESLDCAMGDFKSLNLCEEEFEICSNRHLVTNSQEVNEIVQVVEGAAKWWSRNLWI